MIDEREGRSRDTRDHRVRRSPGKVRGRGGTSWREPPWTIEKRSIDDHHLPGRLKLLQGETAKLQNHTDKSRRSP